MNYYDILNVGSSANDDEIKKAYKQQVKIHHPDKGGDPEKFKQVSEAYETLSDSQKRNQYDIKIGLKKPDINEMWRRAFTNSEFRFSNMFDEAFGMNVKGPNITIRLAVTIDEIYHGTTKYLDTGEFKFNVKIPKGIRSGSKLRIRDKGALHPMNSSAPRGDVILIVQRMTDVDIIVNEDDIYHDVYLSFWDLILGTEIDIINKLFSTKVQIPKKSYAGQTITINGKGMPIYNTDGYGNLIIKLHMKNMILTHEQLEYVKKIKELSNGSGNGK